MSGQAARMGVTSAASSPKNQKLLAAGLKPLMDEIVAERDKYSAKGMTNIALGAKVTASTVRDPRFGPEHIVDNKTWEYPTDGVLDYTQGELKTTHGGGYGRDKVALFGDKMNSWPFYVRPTYWLLSYGQPGWVQLELPQETPVSMVRLLNTSNAGLNDFATMNYRVDLLDSAGKIVGDAKGNFGKLFDRAFDQAFRYPDYFGSYGATYDGMLERGIPVPFGDGWQDVKFEAAKAKFVKVYIDSHWSIGGGLNEVQVYSGAK